MKPYVKFGILVVDCRHAWMAGAGGINETKTYYKTISEVSAMGDALDRRLRVGGDVEKDSIVRDGKEVRFVLIQET